MIDFNSTFFIQFVNFLITLVVLNFLLIRPIREIIKKRNDHMEGMVEATEQFTGGAEEKLVNYKKALDEARVAGTERRNSLKEEGTAEEKGILAAANDEAASTLKAERQKVEAEVKAAMDSLKGQVEGLAGKVTEKVLG